MLYSCTLQWTICIACKLLIVMLQFVMEICGVAELDLVKLTMTDCRVQIKLLS